jgi:hypothetical protein
VKKFVFTLEALAKYKASVEKKQKTELARVLARLSVLYAEREQIGQAIVANSASQARALAKQRELVEELKRHNHYNTFLRAWLAEIHRQIKTAEAEKKRLQALLIVTMKEIKTLERLRAEQFQIYLEETRKEENLLIGDMIAHHSSVAGAE